MAAIQLPASQNLHMKVSAAAKQATALSERAAFTGTRTPRAKCAHSRIKRNLQRFCWRS